MDFKLNVWIVTFPGNANVGFMHVYCLVRLTVPEKHSLCTVLGSGA